MFYFLTDRYKTVYLLQFVFASSSVVSYVAFVLSLFVPHLFFFGASGKLCFVIVVFPGYDHLYFYSRKTSLIMPMQLHITISTLQWNITVKHKYINYRKEYD